MSFNILPLATTYVTTDQFYNMLYILAAGIIIALLYTAYNVLTFGKLISVMRLAGAVGEENAKSLTELGYEDNMVIKNALRRNATLKRKVKKNDKGYYLNSEDLEELSKRYNSKSINARDLLLTLVVLVAIFIAFWLMIPWLTELINTQLLRG